MLLISLRPLLWLTGFDYKLERKAKLANPTVNLMIDGTDD